MMTSPSRFGTVSLVPMLLAITVAMAASCAPALAKEVRHVIDKDQADLLRELAGAWGGSFTGAETWTQSGGPRPCSTYAGVECNGDGLVVKLNLSSVGLSGPVNATSQLTTLTSLDVSENDLSGTLDALTLLINLRSLNVGGNSLEGDLPSGFGELTKLRSLRIYQTGYDGEGVDGPIPKSFSKLVNLRQLQLNQNSLDDKIPLFLGKLTKLTFLRLSNNYLNGPIPKSFSNLKNLRYLGMRELGLSGKIPSGLGTLTRLTYLTLHYNLLEGTIPASFSKLERLDTLTLYNNFLSGPLFDLRNLKHLTFLAVQDNLLTGRLPTTIPQSLTYLNLDNNYFYGSPEIQYKNGTQACGSGFSFSSNCFEFPPDWNCEGGATDQKNSTECAAFCGTGTEEGQCEGRGICVTKPIKYDNDGNRIIEYKCARRRT